MSVTQMPRSARAAKGMSRPTSTSNKRVTYHLLATIIVAIIYGFVTFKQYGRSIFHNTEVNNSATRPLAPLISKSPLEESPWLVDMHVATTSLSDEDLRTLHEIERRAALNIKFLAIPETVYAQEETGRLYDYVEKQLLLAKDVVTSEQAEVVLKLIESRVAQGSMMKKEMGAEGSLKNSMVIAILKEHMGNVHFVMAGVSMEPRLGWRLITKQQRNTWNEVLSRMLDVRLKQEMSMLLS